MNPQIKNLKSEYLELQKTAAQFGRLIKDAKGIRDDREEKGMDSVEITEAIRRYYFDRIDYERRASLKKEELYRLLFQNLIDDPEHMAAAEEACGLLSYIDEMDNEL